MIEKEDCVVCQGGVAEDIETETCDDCYHMIVFELHERREQQ